MCQYNDNQLPEVVSRVNSRNVVHIKYTSDNGQCRTCEISRSHGGEYEDCCLLGYCARLHGATTQKTAIFNVQHNGPILEFL
jgi:hypothetical protein